MKHNDSLLSYFYTYDKYIDKCNTAKEKEKKNEMLDICRNKIDSIMKSSGILEASLIYEYNSLVGFDDISKVVKKFSDSKNKINTERAHAMLNGKTLHYYFAHPEDNVFEDVIITYVNKFVNKI
jgi:hypothetical protein